MPSSSSDTVYLRGLQFNTVVGKDAWGREGKPQPVVISLHIEPDENLEAAAAGDDISKTLDYGKLYKALTAGPDARYESVRHIWADAIHESLPPYRSVKVEIALPKAVLRASGGFNYTLEFCKPAHMSKSDAAESAETVALNGIDCACIIGVNAHERLQKQTVRVDLVLEQRREGHDIDHRGRAIPLAFRDLPVEQYHDLVQAVIRRTEASTFQTVEALATAIAQTVTMDCGQQSVTVRVEKPNAIATIDAAGVQIHRLKSFFANRNFWQVNA